MHPHAEIIKALADNKDTQIQILLDDEWHDVNSPAFDLDGMYRINPDSITKHVHADILHALAKNPDLEFERYTHNQWVRATIVHDGWEMRIKPEKFTVGMVVENIHTGARVVFTSDSQSGEDWFCGTFIHLGDDTEAHRLYEHYDCYREWFRPYVK